MLSFLDKVLPLTKVGVLRSRCYLCMRAPPPLRFQFLKQGTDFHGIGEHPNRMIFNFLQSVIIWQTHELDKCKLHQQNVESAY